MGKTVRWDADVELWMRPFSVDAIVTNRARDPFRSSIQCTLGYEKNKPGAVLAIHRKIITPHYHLLK